MTQTELTPTTLLTGKWKPYPAYKDSGMEWLGEIPAHWEVKRLKFAASFYGGGTPYKENLEYWSGDIPWVSPKDMKAIVSNSFLMPEYLASVIRGHQDALLVEWRKEGATVESIEFELLINSICPMPPVSEQRAIAAFLDLETTRINTLIAKKERRIELLQEKRAALISHAVTKGFDPKVPMKDSGVDWLGEIPAHWKVMKIALAAKKITNGYVGPTRDILVNEGVRYLQSLHIKNGQIRFDKPYYVTQEWSNAHIKSILCEGDVLVVQTGGIGQCSAVSKEFVGCNCHALIIIQLKDGLGSGFYLSAFLRSDYGHNMLLYYQTGALHPHLECGNVREIRILLPPTEEQTQIMDYLAYETAKIDSLVSRIREGIEKLREYSSALISAAVTGKIDVRETISD